MSKNKNWASINGEVFDTVLVGKVQRFKKNRIVEDVYEVAMQNKLGLNEIWIKYHKGEYTKEEMHEFYRLLGYSVCGFADVFENKGDVIDSGHWDGK